MTITDPGDHRYDNGLSLGCHGHWYLGFCCFRVNMDSFSQLMKSEGFGLLVWLQMERNNLKMEGLDLISDNRYFSQAFVRNIALDNMNAICKANIIMYTKI